MQTIVTTRGSGGSTEKVGAVGGLMEPPLEAEITTLIPGGAKKRPELCVTIVAHILYREKFLFC